MKKLLLFILAITSFNSYSQEAYYNDVDLQLTGISLKNALATKITNTHVNFLTYTPDVWIASKITDVNPSNSAEVLLVYGYENGTDQPIDNDRERGINDNGGGSSQWNREHIFPKSLGNPNLGTTGPGSDAHHLRPSDPSRNSSRSNRKFGRGTGNSRFSTIDFHQGLDGPNTAAWYPGDEWKGDVARMIMYMYLRYGSVCLPTAVGVGNNANTPDDMIDLFLVWNVEDPVSDFERGRNTYHENTTNSSAQGNRNPFIDNPFLATRIWGGDSAQDTWGIYTTNDSEAPTVPTDVAISNINFTSFDVTWTASTDNEAVTGYDVFVNGTLTKQTANTTVSISNLNPNTTYSITVLAKDLVNNKSAQSTAVNGTTLQDSIAPSTPTNVTTSNISDSSFKLTWTASTDNNEVASYEVYLNGNLNSTVTELSYTISSLTASTSYTSYVIAKDTSGNNSTQSSTVNATTTAGGTGVASELFISEYVEPAGGNNKAIEIVNLTGSTVDLAAYDLRRNPSGGGSWSDAFFLDSGSIKSILPNDVFVITNPGADNSILVAESDLQTNANIDNGAPLSFNGDDPVGLFKNGVLIDIVGKFNGSEGFVYQDTTLRRNGDVSGPNTTYNEQGEWTSFPENTFDGIGSFTSTLSTKENSFESFNIYPNPVSGNDLFIKTSQDSSIKIYNVLGKLMLTDSINSSKSKIDVSSLQKGIYLLKIITGNGSTTKKLIKS
ncbi:MAG: endonuclease [Polaribacter sp.]|uniref:endonuclease n=1 Tax=Polaribacter sp. TaxID=1920175 RepID=UPI002F35BC09